MLSSPPRAKSGEIRAAYILCCVNGCQEVSVDSRLFFLLQNVAHARWPPGWLYKAVCKNCGDLSHTDRSRRWVAIHQQIEVRTGGYLRKLALTGRIAWNHTIEKNERFVERQKSSDHMEAIDISMTEQTTAYFCGNMMSGGDNYCRCFNLHISPPLSQHVEPELETWRELRWRWSSARQSVVFISLWRGEESALNMCFWNLIFMTVWKKVGHIQLEILDTVSLNVVCTMVGLF